ncbi:adenine deaminase C-terminal domain-containing protein [Companilactobacillus halodurans]|uniref:Adenine deaminase n=1 Tax=Companilactobacillus halodurans TaxID=2584183 RepID=A0A5P0ZXQ7_9LACO|nr:adenine deaminase C-terminal domain-containing protein [Companilactobacillus halodurans]MQS97685.1 amidohydrolase family protein [Companilactobacillus halodurans]
MRVDLLINNGQVFNTFSQEFEKKAIAIKDGKILMVGPNLDFSADKIIDAKNEYIIPGLVDSHMHIESSMTDPANFGNEAVKFGTTTVIADAHEISNVAGIAGLKEFMAQKSVIDVFYALPSSVPSTKPEMETTGGIIGLEEVKELLKNPKIVCLGEAMNFKGIVSQPDSLIRQIIDLCKKMRPTMPLEGHCPQYSGLDLAKFAGSGITSDHTFQTPESIIERINDGMFIQFQNKSLSKENMQTIVKNNLYEYAGFVTDDVMADDLVNGHLNLIVKRAISLGMPVRKAIYMATYTPARRMSLNDRGAIAPGRVADLIFLNDLDNFEIDRVFKNGQSVSDLPTLKPNFSKALQHSVIAKRLGKEDLLLKSSQQSVTANVIVLNEKGTFTTSKKFELPVVDGVIDWQTSGLALLMVQERYGKNGNISFALVKSAIDKKGAIGATWAHDHHNLMVLGTDIDSILKVQHQILDEQGGYVVVNNGVIVADAPLKIGGIISEKPIEQLALELKQVRLEMQNLGYRNFNEIMSFSTISLLVSPELKISDKGMFDVKTQEHIPLFD